MDSFFFFKQKTAYELRISDWSSDVCSSDLLVPALRDELAKLGRDDIMIVAGGVIPPQDYDAVKAAGAAAIFPPGTVIAEAAADQIGRASCRERVCPYV